MAQFCGDIKCEFYDTFPDGLKFKFCPICAKPLVVEKPSLQMPTFCQNRECTFYNVFPNGGDYGFKCCPFCQSPVLTEKPLFRDTEKPLPKVIDPQPEDQPIERKESLVEIKSNPNVISNQFITPIYNWKATGQERNLDSRHDIKFEDVIVLFSTAVLKKHYLQSNGCISLRFKSSSIGKFKFERIEFKDFRQVNYEGNEFVLLDETIKINKSVLTDLKHCEQLLIPYKYYFSDSEEKLYLNEDDCYRNLIIGQYNFIELNTIQKFDMIVLPEEVENEYYYLKQIDTRLSISFNIYAPGEKILLHLPISNTKDEVQTILFSLCNGYYSKISLLKKRKNFQVYDSKEQINSVLSYILYIWLKGLMNASSLPFHSKILLSFFTFENELIQPHSTELFILLFQGVNSDLILSLINSRCDAFSDYISEIKSRPYLLHHAMQGISSKDFSQLVKFLPLYHFLFDSKEYFSIAQSNNAFLDNAYWGLPSNMKFQYYDDVDISVIRDAMSIFHTTDPLLPYSIILLALRSDIFLDLLEIRSIPYLSFFSVLLYRVKTWSLIQQDCELRELVFTTFLEKSEQTPGFMNEDEICHACDVIFRMLDVIKDSPVTLLDKLNLEQAKCTLHVLAKLLELFIEKYPTFLSLEHFHRAESIITSLKTAPVLLTTIRSCLCEDVLQPNYPAECTVFEEVTNVWNALCCIPFPQEYDWTSEVCKQLSKRLSEQTLESILITFVEICNHYNELNNDSIFNCFHTEILEKLRISEIVEKDQRTTFKYIVQVSKEQFHLVADIIATILSSNSSKLNENPVKPILSLHWWVRVVKFSKKLFEFTELDQIILNSLLICADLFLWASRILKNETDLDNLRELALNSIDGSSLEVNCISSFYTLCQLYSPFIYGFNQEIDQESFLNKLSEVHCNIESHIKSHRDVRYKLPEIYKDCTSEANIEFWKTLELKHTLTGGNTISSLNQIMSEGMFLLNVEESSCSVEDIISVQITQDYTVTTYSLNELKEIQGENILISPEMLQDSVGARFQNLLKLILSLSEIVLKFHKSGNVLFQNKKLTYSCDSTDILSEDITFLEGKYKNWINNFEQSRQKCYYLNFFTSSQILTIQIELERLRRFPSKVIEKQAFYLLTILSEELSEEEVRGAFNRANRGSSSTVLNWLSSSSISDEMYSPTRLSMQSSLETSYMHVPRPEPNTSNDNLFHDLSLMSSSQTGYEELGETLITHAFQSQLIKMYQNQPEYICLSKLEKLFRILSSKNDQNKRNF